ncbi:MAG: hypothetical protein ACRDQU_06670 [Pseudonocardiaceae bacterium]
MAVQRQREARPAPGRLTDLEDPFAFWVQNTVADQLVDVAA